MKQRGKMFNQLYLIIEENKLKKRFKGNVVTAVLEVLNKETDVQRLELIYQTLWRFNDAIKFWDDLLLKYDHLFYLHKHLHDVHQSQLLQE